jgi:Zn finger protein HypA/HybF involved in hydrogenase expression
VDIITTRAVDRDGEIVDPEGGIFEHYVKNPVVLWAHQYDQLPIGKNIWIKSAAEGLIAKTVYAKHPFAQEVYQYKRDGFPLATSIGFIPLTKKMYDPKKNNGIKCLYTKWVLLEYSAVPVPSNPEAVEMAVSKGLLPSDQIKFYLLGEEEIEIEDERYHGTENEKSRYRGENMVLKGKKIVCPECGEKFSFVGEEEYMACPKCGIYVNAEGERAEDKTKSFDSKDFEGLYRKADEGAESHKGMEGEAGPAGPPVETKTVEITCSECKTVFVPETDETMCKECSDKKPKKKEEEPVIEKKFDPSGRPSIQDIRNAIMDALKGDVEISLAVDSTESPNFQNMEMYVEDVYPYNYPSGSAIIIFYNKNARKLYAFEYTYAEGKVTLGNKQEVIDGYVAKEAPLSETKEYEEKIELLEAQTKEYSDEIDFLNEKVRVCTEEIAELKEMEDDYITVKEGRVLSSKNIAIIKNSIESTNATAAMLQELLDTLVVQKGMDENVLDLEITPVEKEMDFVDMSVDDVREIAEQVIKTINMPVPDLTKIMDVALAKLRGQVL